MNQESKMAALMKERARMEQRAQELTAYLTGPGMPGLKGGLDDAEGYPRADIDVIGIVNSRHELACLNTDYSNLMKEIETELHNIHAQSKVYVERPDTETLEPFGRITSVSKNSPGDLGGFQVEDLILKFDTLSLKTSSLHTIFEQLPVVTRNKLNQEIPVVTKRGATVSTRLLKPAAWEGNGLLGFRLEPVVVGEIEQSNE
eukprot:Gregarina_sp_Pseudo_9__2905@NODE_3122_length_747_cov_11_398305_g2847_i0_p1_GENE_NODE_3122_length_747_cov_11_398305_g2847_i0NODE_3122_length_747_cov_11_398305_g2847_i0_p1_ORF_typecomplete_len202_score42_80Nas2_N/PF18265_1/1_3e24GRASP55_65/PF04495_14/6_4e06PDZ_6/PF17820_1/0_00037PDZ_2/PF13180_6/0_002_NODE_3122_length_747_cov_11_398305_g2847_i044649